MIWTSEIAGAIEAEVFAIQKACELIVASAELRSKIVVIVSDSTLAVSWVEGSVSAIESCDHAIADTQRLMGIYGNISVVFNSKSSNRLADFLAKRGADGLGDIQKWEFV